MKRGKKMSKRIDELEKKKDSELLDMLNNLNKERIVSAEEKPANKKNIKRVIARIKTILRKRQLKV